MNDSPKQKTAVEHAEFAIKIVGVSAILTAIMGWPAVGLQFAAYGIPADLVSTDAAIRAGILPALTFMAIFGYLWYVRSECKRHLTSEAATRMTPLFLFHVVPLAFIAVLVMYAGVFSGAFVVLWLGVIALGVAGEVGGAIFWIVLVLSIVAGVSLVVVTRVLWQKLQLVLFPLGEETSEKRLTITLVFFRMFDYVQLLKNFAALYLIYIAVRIVAPHGVEWVSVPGLLVMAAFLALASALVGVGIAILKGFADIGLGNLQGSTGFAVVAAILAVLFYSMDVHPELPKSLGGGRPVAVKVWLEKSDVPALGEWPHARLEAEHLRLDSVYLVRLDDKVAVLVDQPKPPGRWAVVPRSSIGLLTARN